MSTQGKTQLTIVFTAPPDLVAEGDRIFASHAKRIADALIRTSSVSVKRDGKACNSHACHFHASFRLRPIN